MSTNEPPAHVSLSIPSEQSAPIDNFQFMSNTFTLPQDGQSASTYAPPSKGYAGSLNLLEKSFIDFLLSRQNEFRYSNTSSRLAWRYFG